RAASVDCRRIGASDTAARFFFGNVMLQMGEQLSACFMEKITMNNASQVEELEALTRSWLRIVEECRSGRRL
ncbi:MAG TPA: hypothetical protein VJ086_06590, partial [Rubrobacteraceae bacterium]|nr:hypothetical protein [Rubrobacteraceae bacterium]